MEFSSIEIPGAYVIKLTPYKDERGEFARLFCQDEFRQIGFNKTIAQINYSINKEKGTLRGLHFQKAPFEEVKIIRCLAGSVFDVIVDLRKDSPTFLKNFSIELTPHNYNAIFIPEGCAHGFQTLEHNSQLLYLHSQFYNKQSEGGVAYNDPSLNVQWPLIPKNMTDRDLSFLFLKA
jgi:dTDP-4-dehydrorhamnose 3,5-epimerase